LGISRLCSYMGLPRYGDKWAVDDLVKFSQKQKCAKEARDVHKFWR